MGQALRLILALPPESATHARLVTDPDLRPTSSRRRREHAWRDVYGRSTKDVLMDIWELQAAKATGGKKGARKKAPRYPDPTRKK